MSKDTLNTVELAVSVMHDVARKAAQDAFAKYGDRDCCGFARITVYEKGSTKMGRALLKAGFRKAYNGGLEMSASRYTNCQSLNIAEAAAEAAAKFLTEHLGVKAYDNSRMD